MKKMLSIIIIASFIFSMMSITAQTQGSENTIDSTNIQTSFNTLSLEQNSLPYANSTLTAINSQPSLNSSADYSTNINNAMPFLPSTNINRAIPVEPSANVTLSAIPPLNPNLMKNSQDNPSSIDGLTPSQTHWWIIDYWCTPSGTQLPSLMDGTFTAVSNTFDNLVDNPNPGDQDDVIMYLPLNVLYGSSTPNNCMWFQFVINFHPNHGISWGVWAFPQWSGSNKTYSTWVGATYHVGHTYHFAFLPNGNDIEFSIVDYDDQNNHWTNTFWNNTIPGTTMLWEEGNFAPASAVEGITTESFITNTPYFQTYIGDGESTYYYGSAVEQWFHSIPGGIKMGVWTGDDSDHYYWAMVGDYYFLNTIEDYGPITGGCVYDQDEILGLSDDYDAFIGGPNVYDGGYIWGEMSTLYSGGNIYLRAHSDTGYLSNVFVFVRNDTDGDWVPICEALTIDNDYPDWIFVGTSVQSFRYISIVGLDWGNSVHLYIDAVKVGVGDDNIGTGYVASISDYGTFGQSCTVADWNNLIGVNPDCNYAYIAGANYDDGGYIVGEMNSEVSGSIYIAGYSSPGYYSNLYVFVSDDYYNWDQVGSVITVTSSTPYWISVGLYSQGFRYVTVVGLDTGCSVCLHLDCIRVQ